MGHFGPIWPISLYWAYRANRGQIGHFGPLLGPLFGHFWPFWAISPKVSRVHFEGPKIGGPRMAQNRPFWAIFGTPFWAILGHFGPKTWENLILSLRGPSQRGSQIWPKMAILGHPLGRPSQAQYGERLGFWPKSGQKWPKRGPKYGPKWPFWAIFGTPSGKALSGSI